MAANLSFIAFMKSLRTWPLFRLAISGLVVRGSCWLLMFGAVFFAWVAPLLTPWQENPQILQPARAQAAWFYSWMALFTWLPFQASALGNRMRREGMLEHQYAGGFGRLSLCMQLGASIWIWMFIVVLLSVFCCLIFALPKRPDEAHMWLILVLQYAVVYMLTSAPLLMLALSLGTITHEIIAFLVPTGLLFIGFFGYSWLGPLFGGADSTLLKSLWIALPHYHLADLTPRLVFKMGPLPFDSFMTTSVILFVQGASINIISLCLFRTRS
jgi:hypothetical protein